jgi:DNA invertase Pin-like site-specific DNA recombinase
MRLTMSKQILAITTCRVSTPEQEENNSLDRQAEAVKRAAAELGAIIPEDGQWSGSVSSKVGNNVKRKDLREMIDYCKEHASVKYLIVHEVDRFMRSVDELFYFEVRFREEVGVKIIYASQPELNTNDHKAKLFKALEAFKGEVSNVERIAKSIDGQTDALKMGRYPFAPKPGYRRGYEKGIPEIHPVKGPALKEILLDIYFKRLTPTDALIKFNKSDFMSDGHSLYKMDKFRKIVTDEFYCGVVYMDKQVKYRNENGLHAPLITTEQHRELVKIMEAKKKYQTGPRKNGNPSYPLSNIVTCALCVDSSSVPRYVGYPHGNGKNKKLVYHKYRCRSCSRYLTRDELHPQIEQKFVDNPLSEDGQAEFLKALDIVWRQQDVEAKRIRVRTEQKIKRIRDAISLQALAAIEPTNILIKEEILSNIIEKKEEIAELENDISLLDLTADNDKEHFLRFAFDFVDNMGRRFLEIDKEDRLRCKQIVFPAGFYLDAENKVYTPQISPLITLQATKKDTEVSDNVHLVRVRGLKPRASSLARKRSIN